ncbi:hypothetical protein EDC94DRAFT_131949 [Helicostylum pulchrum]|nr:hypothetical protein EDC94DRAFT_131949 [Helicostylum pulchrum]
MQHVDQWYRYLTETEKTATIYTLLQHSSQVQARFFINLLQQMVKRDPLFSLLTPNNPDQDMQNHLAGAMAKAELEASQRLMSVLPYKTGQVMSRPQSTTNRRTVDRHSFALGDTEEYSRLFSNGRTGNDLLHNSRSSSPYVSALLDDTNTTNANTNGRRLVNGNRTSTSGRTVFNNGGRPHSVIEGDTTSLFPTPSTSSNWLNTTNTAATKAANRRSVASVIGDRTKVMPERPKSADISNWSLPTEPIDRRSAATATTTNNGFSSVWSAQQHQMIPELDNDLIDFTNSMQQPFRRRANVNRIPVVPETEELLRTSQALFLNEDAHPSSFRKQQPPAADEAEYTSDHSDGSHMSRRRSSSIAPNSRATKDKKAVEVIDMELLKDVPAWLRSLRLHKYNGIFCDVKWQSIIVMSDADLVAKGVAALGARRKMLKVFENIRAHCDTNHIEY